MDLPFEGHSTNNINTVMKTYTPTAHTMRTCFLPQIPVNIHIYSMIHERKCYIW